MNFDDKFMYRVRGLNNTTGRESWVTTHWEYTLQDAELTMRIVSSRWSNLRIIKKNIGEYISENQRVPRFN